MLVKIAPGEDAWLWEECLSGKYICVAWDGLGDLRRYHSREELVEKLKDKKLKDTYPNNPATASKVATELWTIRNLQPGDKVVANKGKSAVLGVGTVKSPGYRWNENRKQFRHTVMVEDWDVSCAKSISTQPRWQDTVVPVSANLFRTITGKTVEPGLSWGEIEKARERRETSVKQRLGQDKFRKALLTIYDGRCAITGCKVEMVLEAAHIYTSRGKDLNTPSNGILLRADVHHLFDGNLLSIEPKGKGFLVRLADSLRRHLEYGRFHNRVLRVPDRLDKDRFRAYLKDHARL